MDGTHFAISYDRPLRNVFVALGMGPGRAGVWLTSTEVRVRMGRWFVADIPLSSLRSITADAGRVTGWGVHGWGGQWLVNASARGLVRLVLEPTARARAIGLPVGLRLLRISLVEPEAFMSAVADARS